MKPSPLLVRRDDPTGLVLAASHLPKIVAAVFFGSLSVGLALSFPDLQAAPMLFGVLALWQAARLLQVHELSVVDGRLLYRRGYRFAAPIYDGSYSWFDDFPADVAEVDGEIGEPIPLEPAPGDLARLTVRTEVHPGDPGLVSSRLRSRRLVLVVRLPGGRDPLCFPLGFPMGPKAAEGKLDELRERLRLSDHR